MYRRRLVSSLEFRGGEAGRRGGGEAGRRKSGRGGYRGDGASEYRRKSGHSIESGSRLWTSHPDRHGRSLVTVRKPKEKFSSSSTVIAGTRNKTARTPTAVWGLALRNAVDRDLRVFSGVIRKGCLPVTAVSENLVLNDFFFV